MKLHHQSKIERKPSSQYWWMIKDKLAYLEGSVEVMEDTSCFPLLEVLPLVVACIRKHPMQHATWYSTIGGEAVARGLLKDGYDWKPPSHHTSSVREHDTLPFNVPRNSDLSGFGAPLPPQTPLNKTANNSNAIAITSYYRLSSSLCFPRTGSAGK